MRRVNFGVLSGLFIISISFIPSMAVQTTGSLEGYVRDAKSGEIISRARILLVFTRNESVKFDLSADKKGHFYKSGLTPGTYKVNLEMEGYLPTSGTVRVRLGVTTQHDIEITPMESVVPKAYKIVEEGIRLLNEGKYAEAEEKFTNGISEEKPDPLCYYYRGFARERQGNGENALADYKKAIDLQPDFILAFSRSGIIHAKQKDFDKAAEFYQKALDLGDKDVTTYYNNAVVLMNQGKSQEAGKYLEQLLILDENYADAYYHLGIIYIGQGDAAKAKEFLEKFVEIDPQNTNAAVAKKILESLRHPHIN